MCEQAGGFSLLGAKNHRVAGALASASDAGWVVFFGDPKRVGVQIPKNDAVI